MLFLSFLCKWAYDFNIVAIYDLIGISKLNVVHFQIKKFVNMAKNAVNVAILTT